MARNPYVQSLHSPKYRSRVRPGRVYSRKGDWRAEWWDDEPVLEGQTVYESDAEPTGLLDKDGNELVRVKDRIGFTRR